MTVSAANSSKTVPLTIPAIQHWGCQNCTMCCRDYTIEVTAEERRRILAQHWTAQDGMPAGDAVFEHHGSGQYRLAHRPDGACVFLDERGLCRIHAKFGEAAKPRTCRVFPFAFHPAGRKVAVSLRFSCPAVAANHGPALGRQRDHIQRLARTVVPAGHERIPPPALFGLKHVDWPVFMHFIAALDETLSTATAPVELKLRRALFWLNLVESHADKLTDGRVVELLDFVRQAACNKYPDDHAPSQPEDAPSTLARLMFRLLAYQYARKDTPTDLKAGWSRRLKLLHGALRMAKGRGRAPALQHGLREIPLEFLERPFGVPEAGEALWTRYLQVKIQGLHFCGRAYHGLSLAEGFKNLALMLPATMYLARWLAASQNRTLLTLEDITQALSISDHHHGYSPVFGSLGFRSRIMILSQWNEIPKLIRWHAR